MNIKKFDNKLFRKKFKLFLIVYFIKLKYNSILEK